MSAKIEDGGCAFPSDSMDGVDRDGNRMPFSPGMSLRDYFAGQALAGFMAYPGDECSGSHHNNNSPEGIARAVYEIADAMLAARSPARSA